MGNTIGRRFRPALLSGKGKTKVDGRGGLTNPVTEMIAEPLVPPGYHKLRLAARCIAAGGIIAYPTEAVYGLGCDPMDAVAVRRILALKQRAESKGLILIAADFAQLLPFVEPLEDRRMEVVRATWPGPVTWLFPARADTPGWLRGSHRSLAVRVTAHPLAAALCRFAGSALVSTSANVSERSPARSALRVRLLFGARLDLVLAGQCGARDRPSTIRDGRSGALIRA